MNLQRLARIFILLFISGASTELLAFDSNGGGFKWETRLFNRTSKNGPIRRKREREETTSSQPPITRFFSKRASSSNPPTRTPIPETATRTPPLAIRIPLAPTPPITLPPPQSRPSTLPLRTPVARPSPHTVSIAPRALPLQASRSSHTVPQHSDYEIRFIRGRENHISQMLHLIEGAEEEILIACWKLKFMPPELLSALMTAKRRGVLLSFFVNEVENETAADYFEENSEEASDSDEESQPGTTFKTKTHAKFFFVDQRKAMFGSFNAFDSSEGIEDSNSSFLIQGTIRQMWPFYMGLYHSYKAIGDRSEEGFCTIAGISTLSGFSRNGPYNRNLSDGSKIWFLTTLEEHNQFFNLAVRTAQQHVRIYSPFIYEENATKRLETLHANLPPNTRLFLYTLPKNEAKLRRILDKSGALKARTMIRVGNFHDKLVIIDQHTMCVSSLNALSAALEETSLHKNVETSVVLQGPRARSLIVQHFYNQ